MINIYVSDFLAQVRSPAAKCLYMVGTQNAVTISFIRPKINFKDGWISKRFLNRALGSWTQGNACYESRRTRVQVSSTRAKAGQCQGCVRL